jgi:epoxyqueuosine reductase
MMAREKGETMNLNDEIGDLAIASGAQFWGIANLAGAHDAIVEQGGSLVADFPFAFSVGIALSHPIVDALERRPQKTVTMSYRHHIDVVNHRLDLIASHIASVLQERGYRSFPVPAAGRLPDDKRICGVFSHKVAARLAGLGWIGKNCLLINPEAGPRARWVSVLTDAPLTPTGAPLEERCGSCTACVDVCPVKAFTGMPFRPGEARDVRFDAGKCDRYFESMKKKHGMAVCGLCLRACPCGSRPGAGSLPAVAKH